MILIDTDIISVDEEHIYSRIPKHNSTFITETTMQGETFSTIKKPKSITLQELPSSIDVQLKSQSATHCSQIIPFYDSSFFKYNYYFQVFFPPDDYSLNRKTLKQQQSQDPVL